jgi:asparagine N-glycosylation enzyme membrane subunit Stt3
MEENKKENNENPKEDYLIEKRKEKVISFFKKSNLWVIIILIFAVIVGVYIRSLPMQDHSSADIPSLSKFILTPGDAFKGAPGLWDITTNTWTLGPDLDPWLFLRYADTIVKQGSLPVVDPMRNVPLGFETAKETRLLPYMIAWTYNLLHYIHPNTNIELAGAVFPVIMFALTIISFFIFVRELFIRKDKESRISANIIALISTFFMMVIPAFLSRTIAGIPEKESAAFFFMFLAFYFFLKAWKVEKTKYAVIIALLAGISTVLMGLIWGGVSFVFVVIAISTFLAFILNKVGKKEFIIYSVWIISSIILISSFSTRFDIKGQLTSLDSGLAFIVFIILLIDFILWNTKLKEDKRITQTRIPHNILSIIIGAILIITLASILLGPGFIIDKLIALNKIFFTPVTGRWQVTVAENRQPYFTEWEDSFGPHVQGIALLFWLFFIGSIVLFKKMLKPIKNKDAWILTGLYVLFFFGLVFSRYSSDHIFNGENFISKAFYYGAAIILIGSLIYYRFRYYKENNKDFEKVDYEYLLFFSLFALCLFSARSAVRLIMVLAPIAPILAAFLIVESFNNFRKAKEDTWKMVFGIFAAVIIILGGFIIWEDYKSIKSEAYSFVPSYYNHQWQNAMSWVRENTPEDAVFAHWWDYGYWVQSIGKRATVTDGGNAISFWNYWTGRLVLTGDNQEDSLNFLYAHNATHLLIDSSDIGKYTAFSSIGSDENYDRYSWIPAMVSDSSQMQETRDGQIRAYQGGSALDEDITYTGEDGKEIFLPSGSAAIIGIIIESKEDNGSITFKQPEGVFYYQGQQIKIPLRYVYFNEQLMDFKTGLNGTAFIIQKIDQNSVDSFGAVIYISPRVMRGFLGQVYLLNDPLDNFPNFKIAHTEPNLIIESINSQNPSLNLREFVYYQGVQGPIKIWEIKYTGKEKFNPAYIETNRAKYINWTL